MELGRSIRIYLSGGQVSGIRYAELVNWTGQALLVPRSRLGELVDWLKVVQRPGVYFLLGAHARSGGARDSLAAYVGESEDVRSRIGQHLEREWQEVLVLTSKDENVTKSHIKYLESRYHEEALKAGRYQLSNENAPTRSGLPRPDQDAMEEFLLNSKLLLGALGHRLLDPLIEAIPAARSSAAGAPGIAGSPGPGGPPLLRFAPKEALATGYVTDDGFVVRRGSTAIETSATSLPPGWLALKSELVETGVLSRRADGLLEFTRDHEFSSPSAAAALVYGNNANGRVSWKADDGRSLRDLEQEEANRSE